jgi:hypothetical protein
VPPADDDRGGALDGVAPSVLAGARASGKPPRGRSVFPERARRASRRAAAQATSTVTFVGFVRASNTAERFWDWATSASISCLDASASMVNVTLMSL